MPSKKILFFGLNRPKRAPSQRYRFEQFFPVLEERGIEYDYRYLLNQKMDENLYAPGSYIQKGLIVFSCFVKLTYAWLFVVRKYEYVFVQKQLFMLGTSFFERQFAKKAKLIYDFDDATWMMNISKANRKLAFLKNPNKTNEIIKVAYKVVVGNDFLANYARQFNQNVVVIPTVVNTENYKRKARYTEKENGKICIGWSGSHTTIEHFKILIPTLEKLKEKYGEGIYFKVIGDTNFRHEKLAIQGIRWSEETEVAELEEIDIGIMPLPYDEWSEGKCGLKGLVYMSMSIPNMMSGVGVNKTIIQHGENGFICDSEADWLTTFDTLIKDFELRKSIGEKGRDTILASFSVDSVFEDFISIFQVFKTKDSIEIPQDNS